PGRRLRLGTHHRHGAVCRVLPRPLAARGGDRTRTVRGHLSRPGPRRRRDRARRRGRPCRGARGRLVLMAAPRWFAHANVNARDLEASERFYVSCFDLTPRGRTAPEAAQDGAGFGLAGVPVRWRGVFLADHRGNRSPVVDLLQWLEPPTEGDAYERPEQLGLVALPVRDGDPAALCALALH